MPRHAQFLAAVAVALTALAAFGTSTRAQQPAPSAADPVVVELYTSQGCSSCPPADALLTRLAAREDVIALGLHVDYWDYLGWRDVFGDSRFSDRQRGYARAAQRRTVYTPQAIVQGRSHVIGNREQDVLAAIEKHRGTPRPVRVRLFPEGERVIVEVTALRAGIGRSVLYLVRYIPERTVRIEAGENAGKRIRYVNIVSDWRRIATWNGQGTMRAMIRPRGEQPLVVLVQKAGFGPILGAARLVPGAQ